MITPTLAEEQILWKKGYRYIAGIDEVGRGCFAGPVVVGAVIFAPDSKIPEGIRDSKLLSPQKRQKLSQEIKDSCIEWSIGEIQVEVINELGIGKATQSAFQAAVKNLKNVPDFLLIDAFYIDNIDRTKQKPIVHGDGSCISIAAGSIIAKVYRDTLMEDLSIQYPEYGFGKHKGYGTKQHQEAIKKHGLTTVHRSSFHLEKFL